MGKTYADLVDEALRVVPSVDVVEARRLYDENAGVLFLDIRESEEVRRGAIPGAIAIPRGILEGHVEDFVPSMDVPLILYCASGNRSALAGQTLLVMGFTDVRNLTGGIHAWASAGNPVGAPLIG
jgi:rhodanese-related sulfurtransferase